jgi:hypothetical protein
MSELSENPDLKEVNAYKKKLNWGEVPAIYQLASSAIGDIDGILTHGFDSAFKQLLNKDNWNLTLLEGRKNQQGEVSCKYKPQILLRHVYDEQHYQLHCYPIIDDERVIVTQLNNPQCSFEKWLPETMQMLFKINSLIPFIVYAFQSGDKADFALMRYANSRVEELITVIEQHYEVVGVKGYSIAEFCKELYRRRPNFQLTDILDKPDETES